MLILKYLFEAEFFDGRKYKQNKEDVSLFFPSVIDENGQIQGKSCMTDIQEAVDNMTIKKFTLIEQAVLGRRISVDLTDGHFDIDNNPFTVEGEKPFPVPARQFKLIYFRVRRQSFVIPARYENPIKTTKIGDGVEVINSQGEKHLYEHVESAWDEKVINEGKIVTYFYVKPKTTEFLTEYMIGWQTTIAGKTHTQKILIK